MKTIILNIPTDLLKRIQSYGTQHGRIPVSVMIRKTVIEGHMDECAYPVYGSTRTETNKISLRLTDAEITAIDKAAKSAGYTRTAWIIGQLEREFG